MPVEKLLVYAFQFGAIAFSLLMFIPILTLIVKEMKKAAFVLLVIYSVVIALVNIALPILYYVYDIPYFIFIGFGTALFFLAAFVLHVITFDISKVYMAIIFAYKAIFTALVVFLFYKSSSNIFVFPIMLNIVFLIISSLLIVENVRTIFIREIRSFYVSPLYYILGFIYLMLTGFFFTLDIHYVKMAVMENSLYNIGFFSNFFLSILCIKLISEEKASGTFEIIMTSPIDSLQYVLGKYLSVLIVYISFLGITLLYPLLLAFFGTPDIGVILSGYVGLFLFGAAVLGLGLIATSLTDSHLVAAIFGVSLAFIMYVVDWLSDMFFQLRDFLKGISVTEHFNDFTQGLVDVQNLIFFLIWIMVTITISTLIVESYKWK